MVRRADNSPGKTVEGVVGGMICALAVALGVGGMLLRLDLRLAGVLGATSDGALGNAANTITLNGTGVGFEAYDSFATSRTFTFSNATAAPSSVIDGAIHFAAALAPGVALPIATPYPTARNSGISLSLSPIASTRCGSISNN